MTQFNPKLKQTIIALSLLLALSIGYAYGYSRGYISGYQRAENLLQAEIETARMSLEVIKQDRQAEMARLGDVEKSYGEIYDILKVELGWIDADDAENALEPRKF